MTQRLEKFEKSQDASLLNAPIRFPYVGVSSLRRCDTYTSFMDLPKDPLLVLIFSRNTKPFPNRDLIYALLKLGVKPTQSDLLLAAKLNDIAITLLLLKYGCQQYVNEALAQACNQDKLNTKMIHFLLKRGADPNTKDLEGQPVLLKVIKDVLNRRYHIFDLHILMQEVAKTKPIQYLSEDKELIKYKEVVESLLAFGANPHVKNEDQETVFTVIDNFNKQQWVNKKYDFPWARAPETQRRVNELRKSIAQSATSRIIRMTNFLHIRASQTPFEIIEIAHKIAKHLYNDDLEVCTRDWNKLLDLVSKQS